MLFAFLCFLIEFLLINFVHSDAVESSDTHETHIINWEVCSAFNSNGRRILSINDRLDSYGPTIRVKAGDIVKLSLTNSICSPEELKTATSNSIWKEYCETALHFHGLSPIGNVNDGVPGFTQPPILHGQTFWYNFTIPKGTCGTFWYHSHSAVQYGDGLRGIFIVECEEFTSHINTVASSIEDASSLANGPLKLNSRHYRDTEQVEEVVIALSDWYYKWNLEVERDSVVSYESTTDPRIDDSLINGHQDNEIEFKLHDSTEIIALRIINSGMSGTQIFHVENHKLIVVETDGILVSPHVVETLSVAVGQRYTVIIKLNDVSVSEPISIVNGCNKMMGYIEKTAWLVKEKTEQVKPAHQTRVKSLPGLNKHELYRDLEPLSPEWSKGIWGGTSDITTIVLDYEYFSDSKTKEQYGTGMYKVNGQTLTDFLQNPIELKGGEVVQIVINSIDHMRHPWHLHGHPFQLVSIGNGGEGPLRMGDLSNAAGLRYQEDLQFWRNIKRTPMTRDSINVPGASFAVIRMLSNQPGYWLMHCHVDWHVAKGLGVAFHELPFDNAGTITENTAPSTQSESTVDTEENPQKEAPVFGNKVKVLSVYVIIMIIINCIIYRTCM